MGQGALVDDMATEACVAGTEVPTSAREHNDFIPNADVEVAGFDQMRFPESCRTELEEPMPVDEPMDTDPILAARTHAAKTGSFVADARWATTSVGNTRRATTSTPRAAI